MNEPRCESGCIRLDGHETRHHKDCVYYPESLTRMLDEAEKRVKHFERVNFSTENTGCEFNFDEAIDCLEKAEILICNYQHLDKECKKTIGTMIYGIRDMLLRIMGE